MLVHGCTNVLSTGPTVGHPSFNRLSRSVNYHHGLVPARPIKGVENALVVVPAADRSGLRNHAPCRN